MNHQGEKERTERVEYRVALWRPRGGPKILGPYPKASIAEAVAEYARRRHTDVRVQTRTVTTCPWTDLPGEPK